MKVAKLVCISLMTRVIVEDTATEEQILEIARPNFQYKLDIEMSENIESIADDTEMPYEVGEEYKDKHGFALEVGDDVEVPEPNDSDIHNSSFVGRVDSFRNGNVVVVDGDGDAFEIEPERLELQ